MADPRFFTVAGPMGLGKLAEIAGAELSGGSDPERLIKDVAPLDQAGAEHVSFLDNKAYIPAFEQTKAGAILVDPSLASRAPEGAALLLTKKPYHGYARIAQAFYPEPAVVPGIHATAVVDAAATVDPTAHLGVGVVVGPGAAIGAGCLLESHVVIGAGVVVGAETRIGANATLTHCQIGQRVLIHPGVRIGQRGFGFAMGPEGHLKVPQLGRVIVHDDVEIGANATIDRGTGPDTVIGPGCMIDNLVQIAHNVQLGRGCVIVAQAGIAGSTKLEDFVVVAAQGGVAGHLTLGTGARVAAQGGVMRDVPAGQTVGGSPAVPQRDWLRQSAWLARESKKKGNKTDG